MGFCVMSYVPTGQLALSQDCDCEEKPCSTQPTNWRPYAITVTPVLHLSCARHRASGCNLLCTTTVTWRNHCYLHFTGEETGTKELGNLFKVLWQQSCNPGSVPSSSKLPWKCQVLKKAHAVWFHRDLGSSPGAGAYQP